MARANRRAAIVPVLARGESAMNQQSPEHNVRPKLVVGDLAPDVSLADQTGVRVTLASLWQSRPRVLLFVRHFG
jgi:cytochrome oxidase Cu insertion factor (SCO1/SenC/PrrC family)